VRYQEPLEKLFQDPHDCSERINLEGEQGNIFSNIGETLHLEERLVRGKKSICWTEKSGIKDLLEKMASRRRDIIWAIFILATCDAQLTFNLPSLFSRLSKTQQSPASTQLETTSAPLTTSSPTCLDSETHFELITGFFPHFSKTFLFW